jgi:hypothetical protein
MLNNRHKIIILFAIAGHSLIAINQSDLVSAITGVANIANDNKTYLGIIGLSMLNNKYKGGIRARIRWGDNGEGLPFGGDIPYELILPFYEPIVYGVLAKNLYNANQNHNKPLKECLKSLKNIGRATNKIDTLIADGSKVAATATALYSMSEYAYYTLIKQYFMPSGRD